MNYMHYEKQLNYLDQLATAERLLRNYEGKYFLLLLCLEQKWLCLQQDNNGSYYAIGTVPPEGGHSKEELIQFLRTKPYGWYSALYKCLTNGYLELGMDEFGSRYVYTWLDQLDRTQELRSK